MKPPSIYRRFLLPITVLVFIPAIACVFFYFSIREYTLDTIADHIQFTLDTVTSLEEKWFSPEDSQSLPGFLEDIQRRSFFPHEYMSLVVFSDDYRLLYPHSPGAQDAISPVAKDLAEALANGNLKQDVPFISSEGIEYIVGFIPPPSSDDCLGYAVAFYPTHGTDEIIKDTALRVLVISGVLIVLAIFVLQHTAKEVSDPLQQLGEKAQRIGKGCFEPIEPAFSLREPEELRQAMNRMAEQLEQSDKDLQMLMERVSHDLRTPLMSIAGYAQGIQQGVFSRPDEAVDTIIQESMRMSDMVSNLLVLSRLSNPRTPPVLSSIPAVRIARECIKGSAGLAVQFGISVDIDAAEPEIPVIGTEDLLNSVLVNLLSNGIRYARSTVKLAIRSAKENVIITVSDDGPGIDENDLPHIFERFYTGKDGRFGLGLPLAKNAAHLMDGTLEAANSSQGGALFTLILRHGR